jgi:hypothetical protein
MFVITVEEVCALNFGRRSGATNVHWLRAWWLMPNLHWLKWTLRICFVEYLLRWLNCRRISYLSLYIISIIWEEVVMRILAALGSLGVSYTWAHKTGQVVPVTLQTQSIKDNVYGKNGLIRRFSAPCAPSLQLLPWTKEKIVFVQVWF